MNNVTVFAPLNSAFTDEWQRSLSNYTASLSDLLRSARTQQRAHALGIRRRDDDDDEQREQQYHHDDDNEKE